MTTTAPATQDDVTATTGKPAAKTRRARTHAEQAPKAPRSSVVTPESAAPVTPEAPAAAPVEAVPAKLKLVRDSFTMPETEYAQLAVLKRRALGLAHHAKKSELLRAGIAALVALDDAALLLALQAVPPLKTGRPGKAGPDAAVDAKAADKHKAKNNAKNR
ncbi:MAG: hypothetical protein RLY71_2771 [Pseudomonadota bacterium]|jgi:hypothetical protein